MRRWVCAVAAAFILGSVGSAQAVTITGEFPAFPGGPTALIFGDALTTNVEATAADLAVAGSAAFEFVTPTGGTVIEFTTVNPNGPPFAGGVKDLEIAFNDTPDFVTPLPGVPSAIVTITDGSGAQINPLAPPTISIATAFLSSPSFFLVARWSGWTGVGDEFDMTVQAIPLPASLLFLITAVFGLFGIGIRRRQSPATA